MNVRTTSSVRRVSKDWFANDSATSIFKHSEKKGQIFTLDTKVSKYQEKESKIFAEKKWVFRKTFPQRIGPHIADGRVSNFFGPSRFRGTTNLVDNGYIDLTSSSFAVFLLPSCLLWHDSSLQKKKENRSKEKK